MGEYIRSRRRRPFWFERVPRIIVEACDRWRWSRNEILFSPGQYVVENNLIVPRFLARLHFMTIGVIRDASFSPLLQTDWYLAVNLDVAGSHMTATYHFLKYGLAEDRSPNAQFSANYCRESGGCDPSRPALLNYLDGGFRGGCEPHPFIDEAYVRETNPSAGSKPALVVYLESSTELRTSRLFQVRR